VLLEGLHIPITTPFHPDGRLNPRKLAANVVRYSKTPAAGLIVLGPSGEPTLLSDDETREVLRTAAEAAAPEKLLIAGISRDSVHATLALADYAVSLNYDAILVGVPSVLAREIQLSYRSMTNDLRHQLESRVREQHTFFQSVADRSPLPVILLHEDHREVIQEAGELASHPNIIGILGDVKSHTKQRQRFSKLLECTAHIQREVAVTPTFAAVTSRMTIAAGPPASFLLSTSSLSSGTAAVVEPLTLPLLRTRKKTVSFQIICANASTMLDGLNSGAVGIAPALATAAPQACYEVFAARKDQDQPLAEEKQQRLFQAARLAEATPGSLKFACDLNGYFGGHPRLPHLPPSGAERAELEQLMKPLRN
jgi:4-hydroxy-2-oxoglutarate aldolase